MADGHGGPRTPEHPAPVSGPGALSRRTDGSATQAPMLAGGGPYGDRKDLAEVQGGAALAGGGNPQPAAAGPSARDMLPGLGDPSGRPDEPVTAGVDAGAGIGSMAAGIGTDASITNEQLRPLLRSLELVANMPGSNPETRSVVRNLKARLSGG